MSAIVTLCHVAYLAVSPLHPETRHETLLASSYAACAGAAYGYHLGIPDSKTYDLYTKEGYEAVARECGPDLDRCRLVK